MNAGLFSEHWHKARTLRPKLAPDVAVERHQFRGEPWFVLRHPITQTHHRVDVPTFELISSMDGDRTVEQIWRLALERQGDAAPDQNEFVRLLSELHAADLLRTGSEMDTDALFSRGRDQKRRDRHQRFVNPLFMRFPLFDPDRLLDRITPFAGWLFGRWSLRFLAVLVLVSGSVIALSWRELMHDLNAYDLLSSVNVLFIALVYPLMKLLHELGHGIAAKRLGGEVHECGISLLVLLPLPYVDASAATSFSNKYHRILVGSAGVCVEVGLAAIGALVWSLTSDGLLAQLALNVFLVGSVSTLLFNGNPLLKFDGYYVLSDWLEMPNLADRSKRFLADWTKRRLFGVQIESAGDMPGEKAWLTSYGIAAFLYRVVLTLTIAYFISAEYFVVGVLLAAWLLGLQVVLPVLKSMQYLASSPELGMHRVRAVSVTAALAAIVGLGLFGVPVPNHTTAKGVVWLPEQALVRVDAPCLVDTVAVASGQWVQAGEPLFTCERDELEGELELARAAYDEIEVRKWAASATARVDRSAFENELATWRAKIALLQEKLSGRTVVAARAGQVAFADERDLLGRFFEHGDVAAYLVPREERSIRVALAQSEVGDVQRSVEHVEIRFAQAPQRAFVSTMRRETPAASYTVASPSLTSAGGGDHAADPGDESGTTTVDSVFDFELAMPEEAPPVLVGSHVHVRFSHSKQPLGSRLLTRIERAFLGHIDV